MKGTLEGNSGNFLSELEEGFVHATVFDPAHLRRRIGRFTLLKYPFLHGYKATPAQIEVAREKYEIGRAHV